MLQARAHSQGSALGLGKSLGPRSRAPSPESRAPTSYTRLVWQPSKKQWRVIWPLAIFALLAWPAANGSLAVKSVRWLADPNGTLPHLPPPLSMEMGDNGDAVAEHDAEEQAYYAVAAGSGWTRTRLRLAELNDPFDPATERQLLIGILVIGGLLVWRIGNT